MGMGRALAQRWAKINDRYIAAHRPCERRRQLLRQHLEGAAACAAVGDPRPRRLSRDPPGADRRRHDRRLDHDGPRARADRDRDRQLARLHCRPGRASAAVRRSCARLPRGRRRHRRCRRRRAASTSSRSPSPRPGGTTPIVSGCSLRARRPGEALGIIGPSGAGKTSLVRALIGIWPPARGDVRLDGAAARPMGPGLLGRHIGFVSQTVELFDGHHRRKHRAHERRAGQRGRAARRARAGAHDMILRLPNGYDTRIGEGGAVLSGGQRAARRARARAVRRPVPGRARRAELQSRQRGRGGVATGDARAQGARRHRRPRSRTGRRRWQIATRFSFSPTARSRPSGRATRCCERSWRGRSSRPRRRPASRQRRQPAEAIDERDVPLKDLAAVASEGAASRPRRSVLAIRKLNLIGIAIVVVLVGGFGGWAATSELSGAVIAPGTIVVESNVKKVQHPTGGVVGRNSGQGGQRGRSGPGRDAARRYRDQIHARRGALAARRIDGAAGATAGRARRRRCHRVSRAS